MTSTFLLLLAVALVWWRVERIGRQVDTLSRQLDELYGRKDRR
jgi:hypothetical protein